MEILFKCAALALLCCLVCLLIRRTNPEISLTVSLAVVTSVVMVTVKISGSFSDIAETAGALIGTDNVRLDPLLKCVIIAAVTKLTSELCRDSSQNAAAASVEMAGTVCAMAVSAPLMINLLKLIGDMV